MSLPASQQLPACLLPTSYIQGQYLCCIVDLTLSPLWGHSSIVATSLHPTSSLSPSHSLLIPPHQCLHVLKSLRLGTSFPTTFASFLSPFQGQISCITNYTRYQPAPPLPPHSFLNSACATPLKLHSPKPPKPPTMSFSPNQWNLLRPDLTWRLAAHDAADLSLHLVFLLFLWGLLSLHPLRFPRLFLSFYPLSPGKVASITIL